MSDTITERVRRGAWSNPFSAQRCAARGARLLDRKRPEWKRAIDLSEFTVTNGSDCPMGQTYGSFYAGMRSIKGWTWPVFWFALWPEWHGFMPWYGDGRELDWAWSSEICERLSPAPTAICVQNTPCTVP